MLTSRNLLLSPVYRLNTTLIFSRTTSMAIVRFGTHSKSRLLSSSIMHGTVSISEFCAEEQLYSRLASHQFSSTSQAVTTTVPLRQQGYAAPVYRPEPGSLAAAMEVGQHTLWPSKVAQVHTAGPAVLYRHKQAAASASVRQFSSSSQTRVASQQAEGSPASEATTVPLSVSVLEKVLRDHFPLGPPPQVIS